MEGEQRHYALRSGSRSRSETPLVQSGASSEQEVPARRYDPRTLSRAGSRTPADVPDHCISVSSSLATSSVEAEAQILEKADETRNQFVSDASSLEREAKRAESGSVGAKKAERRPERAKAKRPLVENGETERKDDGGGRKADKGGRKGSPRRIFTSDYSSEEGEREDASGRANSAHEIYKQAGDWWNVFPKTDYTYSERSQCRYEIAPGILAMPNMSRRSIHSSAENTARFSTDRSDGDVYESADGLRSEAWTKAEDCTRVDEFPESRRSNSDEKSTMRCTELRAEQHLCQREIYSAMPKSATSPSRTRQRATAGLATKRTVSRKCDVASTVDSDFESEDALSSTYSNARERTARPFTIYTLAVVSFFRKLMESLKVKTIGRREYLSSYEYRRQHDSRWVEMWRKLDRILQHVYLFMVKVFCFDSWLLSRVTGTRRWTQRRSAKVLWIAVPPLLLLAGCRYLPYVSSPFPPSKSIGQLFREPSAPIVRDADSAPDRPAAFVTGNDYGSILEQLNRRIAVLEDRSLEHAGRPTNASTPLRRSPSSEHLWSRYENEFAQPPGKGACSGEIELIKSQLERLREVCSEARSCGEPRSDCGGRDEEEVLARRVRAILADYVAAFVPAWEPRGAGEERAAAGGGSAAVTEERVHQMVKEALKVYDADKTGRVDYALESAGGQVISTRCTQRYDMKSRAFKLLAFTLYHENNNPRTVIQGNPIQPGACWAFQGFPGYLLIKLRGPIRVTGFTLEHAPKSILPNGEMKSAPKKFNVWGFVDENDPEPSMFGDYEFAASEDSLQYFPVRDAAMGTTAYEYVELRVHSNHGQLEYTCLYRFRVHGTPV